MKTAGCGAEPIPSAKPPNDKTAPDLAELRMVARDTLQQPLHRQPLQYPIAGRSSSTEGLTSGRATQQVSPLAGQRGQADKPDVGARDNIVLR